MSAPRKRFAVASGLPPSAEEAGDAAPSGRQDVQRSAARSQARTAYTWRLTADQALAMDDLMLRIKRELGRGKLDKAELLAALVGLSAANPAVFGALIAWLQADQAS